MNCLSSIIEGVNMYFFNNGEDAFDYLIDHVILKAKKNIKIQMFIWRDDQIGKVIANALFKAANQGVKIYINKDLLGAIFEIAEENRKSLFHKYIPWYLKIKGFLMDKFYPMEGKPKHWHFGNMAYIMKFKEHKNIFFQGNRILKNHSKYLIVDDEIFVVSGMNFEQKEYTYDLLNRKYYDFMFIIKSKKLVSDFLEKKDNITFDLLQPSKKINIFRNITTSFNVKKGLLNCILQGKKEIDVIMAYWDFNEIVDLLIKQCKQGIKLNIYLPKCANIQNDLNFKVLNKIYRSTNGEVNIFLCSEMIHGKLILIDKNYLIFGSANFNSAGLDAMLETNIGLFSKEYALNNSIVQTINKIKESSSLVEQLGDIKYNPFKALIESLLS